MFKTVGNWFLGLGGLLSFTGLLFLPAALNGRGMEVDEKLLGAGLTIFATGALVAAGGFYVKARSLQANVMSDPNLSATLDVKRREVCELCRNSLPVITCTMHKRNLCATCLVEHYEPLSCVYIPALRKSGERIARASFATRG